MIRKLIPAPAFTAFGVTAVIMTLAPGSAVAQPSDDVAGPVSVLGGTVPRATATESLSPRPAYSSFAVTIGNFTTGLRTIAIPVRPGAEVPIRGEGAARGGLSAVAGGGRLRRVDSDGWRWTAPEQPGFHPVRLVGGAPPDTITVTFMVVRPASEVREGALNGYPIGGYRPRPASMSAAYDPPLGFIEARPEDYDILVSPNFRLGQFLCKQPGDPRYLLVSPRLLVKLEAILVAVNEAGVQTPSLTVMSGFRTPAYNRAIGNTTDFSRHLWGDAADIYVDVDGDDQMDDVNGDGRSDIGDARWLSGVVERLMRDGGTRSAPGGLAVYRRNAAHGPFVHVDSRGYRARW